MLAEDDPFHVPAAEVLLVGGVVAASLHSRWMSSLNIIDSDGSNLVMLLW